MAVGPAVAIIDNETTAETEEDTDVETDVETETDTDSETDAEMEAKAAVSVEKAVDVDDEDVVLVAVKPRVVVSTGSVVVVVVVEVLTKDKAGSDESPSKEDRKGGSKVAAGTPLENPAGKGASWGNPPGNGCSSGQRPESSSSSPGPSSQGHDSPLPGRRAEDAGTVVPAVQDVSSGSSPGGHGRLTRLRLIREDDARDCDSDHCNAGQRGGGSGSVIIYLSGLLDKRDVAAASSMAAERSLFALLRAAIAGAQGHHNGGKSSKESAELHGGSNGCWEQTSERLKRLTRETAKKDADKNTSKKSGAGRPLGEYGIDG